VRVLFLSAFIVIIDQISKLWIKGISIPALGINWHGLPLGRSYDILGSFFRITFVENPGMAFGISVGTSSKLFLSLFSLFASIALIYYLYKMRRKPLFYRISLALIIAGAVGNLIDRAFYGIIYGYAPLFYGKVVDFLNFDFFDFSLFGHYYDRFPIFNIADSSVTIGVALLLIYHYLAERRERKAEREADENSEENISEEENNISTALPKADAKPYIPKGN
jgi:signal peptidase II